MTEPNYPAKGDELPKPPGDEVEEPLEPADPADGTAVPSQEDA